MESGVNSAKDYYSLFELNLILTDRGLANVNEVLQLVFYYINFI